MATPPVLQEPVASPAPTGYAGEQVSPTDLLANNPELQNAVRGLCKHFINLDKWVRRQEVIEARRQRFYWRSDQYIYWKNDTIGFVPAVGGQAVGSGDDTVEMPRYTDVYNIYTPYGESILSTLVQNPPGVNWQPSDPSKAEDITASQVAEKFQQKIEHDNNRKAIQTEMGRLYFTDGRTISYARQEEDRQLITMHGVLETKVVPITAKCQDDLVAIFISDELDLYRAQETYPDYAQDITATASSLGESAYERIARLGVLQGTRMLMQAGDAFSHMVTRHVVFLRPDCIRKADEAIQDRLRELFPDGIKVIFCGDAYCGAENTSMDDEVAISFPFPGDGMSRPSIGKKIIPLQDVFNDEINLWHEAHDYCVPTIFMYSETGDVNAIREQISEPGTVIPFTSLPPGATSAESAFYASVLEAIPATLPNFVQFIQGPLAQFLTGAFPALFGGDTGDNDTAKGIAIQRDQAMGRMGLPWSAMQEHFACMYRQAVALAVKNATDDETFTYATDQGGGNLVAETLHVSDLQAGSFECIPDTDSGFPETTSAKKATIQTLMAAAERNPILADVMSQPDNQEYAHELLGLPDIVIPGAEARNKQLIEISQLLKEEPIPPSPQEIMAAGTQNPQLLQAFQTWQAQVQQARAAGQNPPPAPIPPQMFHSSVPVDPDWDFHQYEAETIKIWLSGPDCRKEILKGNIQGVQNVKLHGLQHQQLAQKQQMEQALMQAPAQHVGPRAAADKMQGKQPQGATQ